MTIVKPSRRRCAEIGGRERPVDPLDRAARGALDRLEREAFRVLDIGKIDLRLERRHGVEEARADRLAFAAERPACDPLRLAPLRLGLRFDQIGEALDFGKVNSAVQKGAPGEFSRLGRPKPGNERERLDHRGNDGAPPGHADFRHVLAAEAARRPKMGDQGTVERFAGEGMAKGPQDGAAVGKLSLARKHPERRRTARTGQAQDRDRRSPGAGGERENRIVIVGEHGAPR